MLPPIRYPLPSLVTLIVVALATWKGAELTRTWRLEFAARLQRSLEGPPIPASPNPEIVAGPMTRRALLLHDETIVRSKPVGPAVETIDRRMFVDVYNVWPSPGPITHYRIGNRKPVGWVSREDLFEWNTRLVLKPKSGRLMVGEEPGGDTTLYEVGQVPVPIVSWTEQAVEVALWDRPWSRISRRGWIKVAEIPGDTWGILIGNVELPMLLRKSIESEPELLRLHAIIGRLADNRTWSRAEVESLKKTLPAIVMTQNSDPSGVAERLAEANAHGKVETSWSGSSFYFLSIFDLP